LGTTGCKAVVFDEGGKMLSSAYREYPLKFPQTGWIELDSHRVMASAKEVIREAAHQAKKDPIRALAVASQGEAVTPVGADGKFLHNGIVTFDARTAPLVEWWERKLPRQRIFEISGMPLHGMYTASKIVWWQLNRPEIFAQARHFLCYQDLLIQQLGLPPAIDLSLAARTMLLDIDKGAWSGELCGAAGIDPERLATPLPSGRVIGEIGTRQAKAFGLPPGVVAVTGGHDQPCGALGAGVVEDGVGTYATGTVECITPAFKERVVDPRLLENNIACYPHVVPGLFVALTFNFTGGSLLKWYRDTFAVGEKEEARKLKKDVYDLILSGIPKEPTSIYILPHFTATGTPHFDTNSKGVIAGLRLSTTRGEIVRAVLEGVTYEMALNARVLRDCGAEIESFRAIGGGAKSAAWMQLKADLLGKPVHAMRVSEAVCLGAAILAGAATGRYSTAREASLRMSKIERTYRPDPRKSAVYAERFGHYRELYPALKHWLHTI
ncbi:MAG TPA: FGGY-family carbohydrate kinase, partial [Planctomycetota bacterium]|nr:FGGY-family carbohydrate kinase [Planctomycetota bacterium]